MSNSPTKAELRAAFTVALAAVKKENQTLNQQFDAAKKETVRIQKECDIIRKLLDGLKEQRHEAEEKCRTMEKNGESAKQELQKEIKTKKDEMHRKSIQVKKLEEQLEDMKNSMTTSLKDNELSQLREINDFQKQIIGKGEEIYDLQKQIIGKGEEISDLHKQLIGKGEKISELELKLVKLNYKLQEATKKLELHMLRLALFAFEKALVGIRDPKFRGDDWETFFATNDYEGLLEEEGYKGSVRQTIISLFSRMNNNAHDVYDMEQDLVLTSNNFNPDEVQFLTALWKIQPLSRGSLTFVSSDE